MSELWIPAIEVESVHGTREVSLRTKHLMDRKIFLTGQIDAEQGNVFLSQMLYLEQISSEPVTVYINSPGGEVNSGLMIYDAIVNNSLTLNTVCAGLAASMAAIILAAGTTEHRYILEHSKVMIHEPLISNGVGGSATSIKNISESILETRDILNEILAKHCHKTIDEINKATQFDNFMNASESIEFGICDKVANTIRVA